MRHHEFERRLRTTIAATEPSRELEREYYQRYITYRHTFGNAAIISPTSDTILTDLIGTKHEAALFDYLMWLSMDGELWDMQHINAFFRGCENNP